jgi:Kef-type K+ transport system membrane component KefB
VSNSTLVFLSQAGFAMLMFSAGMRVPLSGGGLRASLGRGTAAAAIVAVLAVPAGILLSLLPGVGHPAVYVILLASGSAAIVLPVIQERGLKGEGVLVLITQVTVADILATLAIPFVLRPSAAGRAAVGTVVTAACVGLAFLFSRLLRNSAWVPRLREEGKRRNWALDLRVALIALFTLAWVAQRTGASVLIAGFGAGLMVAAIGGPKRLSTQVLGIAGGFFVPLFFVVLGASIELRGVVQRPALIVLTCALVVAALVIHFLAGAATAQRPAAALMASAQLGVPSAVVALGLADHVISSTVAGAILTAAMATVVICGIGGGQMAKASKKKADPGGSRLRLSS